MPIENDKPIIRPVLDDCLYVAQGVDAFPEAAGFHIFKPEASIRYFPLCDDFGPMNLACVASFILQLDKELGDFPNARIVYCVEDGRRSLTNAVFLLGCYLILSRELSVGDAMECFSWLGVDQYEEYRDATFSKPTFRLALEDCWSALAKAVNLGWLDAPDTDGFCGDIDVHEYAHYDDPLNGDMHEVVPGKLIAFVGPHDLPADAHFLDDEHSRRRFSPAFFADLFSELGVSTVVRLNEEHYDGAAFAAAGLTHLDLPFDDCTAPPPAVAAAFLRAVDAAPGLVAVHCKAGLGRTGTLIALHLMRSHGFTAREAMGWLRIMRPGSVIGEQQHYLVAMEPALKAAASPAGPAGPDGEAYAHMRAVPAFPEFDLRDSDARAGAGAGAGGSQSMAAEAAAAVWAGVERQRAGMARCAAGAAGSPGRG
jgi:cell division cycle 14